MAICVICWSTSGIFIQCIDWHPLVISCIRSAVAALFMLAVQGKRMFADSSWKTGMHRVYGVPTLLTASLASGATKILYVTANKLTSPANAILLQHSAPIWTALLGWFLLGETLRKTQWITLGMGIIGIILFLCDGIAYGGILGDGVALLCGVTFAMSMVFLRMQKEGSPALALFFSHLIPVAIGLPFLFAYPPEWTFQNAGSIIFLGLIQIGVASLLYAYAIKRIKTLETMLVAQIEPVLNPVWVFIFSGESPSFFAFLGGGIIITAVLISAVQKKDIT
jgi:drug/metabolite transporter (DMT)-like permease